MRVLVTGAGGYIGSAVVTALLDAGHKPVAMLHDHVPPMPNGVEACIAELCDQVSLTAAVAEVDAVCHLAGLTRARESWTRPLDYFAVNVGGTVNLLHAMDQAGVSLLVFASTGSIYGSPPEQPMTEHMPDAPPHPYAASKAAAESVVLWESKRRSMSAAVLRLFNAAGRTDPDSTRIVPRLIATATGESTEFAVNGDGRTVRDYLHVDDVAEAFVAALSHPPTAGTLRRYNIGSGVGTTIADMIAVAELVTGRAVPVTHKPAVAEPRVLVSDPGRAMAELHWAPRRSELSTILRDAWSARG